MKVKNIKQTCVACPSQWEGNLIDGRMFYARYRWGALSIELSKEPTNDVYKAMGKDGNLIYSEQLGGRYDGSMEQAELIKIMEGCGFIFNSSELTGI